ncbi:hypothetical protein AMS68_002894 [Peltaster fructicola]|uniref:ethanolamine-phosphate cytidylyltransferase n=1 Tax=Peltaster fructicola TaxID=286661 RepID=A0A6H0XRJ3_9PEZI|nr:hypothetical protein AMS68_002894 [Peltaster fructicola]
MAPNIDPEVGCVIPSAGNWPIAPQEDVPIEEGRLWIDGCFDFFHHGHAGVMLQARRLGEGLYVGLHSDEAIAKNKGPTVMSLAERAAAIEACRWSTLCVPHAPYVTSLPWISHYGCKYVVHGDDITSDANGEDCYRFVKKANRMKIVPRTPGISTTDLVGRMLLCTKTHHIDALLAMLDGKEGKGGEEERIARGTDARRRLHEYAAAPNGKDPLVQIFSFTPRHRGPERRRSSVRQDSSPSQSDAGRGVFSPLVTGVEPKAGQRIVYVDGGFDLFSSGHIAFLHTVFDLEDKHAQERGWYTPDAKAKRIESGSDYPPAYIIAGIHDDTTINYHKGINYPIMNMVERGLCVIQCRYIHTVVFNAPHTPSKAYLSTLPPVTQAGKQHPDVVYHGSTSSMPMLPPSPVLRRPATARTDSTASVASTKSVTSKPNLDTYADARSLGIFVETQPHAFQGVTTEQIVQRILDNRIQYEERQRKKGMKVVGEEAAWQREKLEKEAEAKKLEREKRLKEIERQFGA